MSVPPLKEGSKRGTLIEGKYTEQQLSATAKTIVFKKTANSKILDIAAEELIPKFDERELTVGRVLGRGGFCVVNEITKIKLIEGTTTSTAMNGNSNDNKNAKKYHDNNEDTDEHIIYSTVQDREFIEKHCVRIGNKGNNNKDCRYAIKKLQDSCYGEASTFINGIVDLAVEARFLSVIRHANIIKMRAMSISNPYDVHFFVILDRLYDILTTRISKWKKQRPQGMKKLILDRGGKKELLFWLERFNFAYDLACALKFLHNSNIMYRDIKPDNIGFDVRGDIKIFDFGLAKEFDPTQRDKNGYFNFTADTGSPRYMDPAVALGQPYNEKCDVYSFCILCWQMLELETPFEGFSMNMFTKKVIQGGVRPMPNPKWSNELQQMLRRGWGDIKSRQSMTEVCETIRKELSKHSDEEVHEFVDLSRTGDASVKERMQHFSNKVAH